MSAMGADIRVGTLGSRRFASCEAAASSVNILLNNKYPSKPRFILVLTGIFLSFFYTAPVFIYSGYYLLGFPLVITPIKQGPALQATTPPQLSCIVRS